MVVLQKLINLIPSTTKVVLVIHTTYWLYNNSINAYISVRQVLLPDQHKLSNSENLKIRLTTCSWAKGKREDKKVNLWCLKTPNTTN